jgi:amino acid permease
MLALAAVIFVAFALVLAYSCAICKKCSPADLIPDFVLTAICAWVGGTLLLGLGPSIANISVVGALGSALLAFVVTRLLMRTFAHHVTGRRHA